MVNYGVPPGPYRTRVYRFDNPGWTLLANAFTGPIGQMQALSADFVVSGSGSGLRGYQWDGGTTITQITDSDAPTGVGNQSGLHVLNATDILVCYQQTVPVNDSKVKIFRWDGNRFNVLDFELSIPPYAAEAIVARDGSNFMVCSDFHSPSDNSFRDYQLLTGPTGGPYAP
jgi:hypothetical protein